LGSGVVMLVQHLASNEAVLGDTLIQTTLWEDGNISLLYCWSLVNFPNLTIQFPWGHSPSFFYFFFLGWVGMRKKTLNHQTKTLCACKSMGECMYKMNSFLLANVIITMHCPWGIGKYPLGPYSASYWVISAKQVGQVIGTM
jgi:hypothetical protein